MKRRVAWPTCGTATERAERIDKQRCSHNDNNERHGASHVDDATESRRGESIHGVLSNPSLHQRYLARLRLPTQSEYLHLITSLPRTCLPIHAVVISSHTWRQQQVHFSLTCSPSNKHSRELKYKDEAYHLQCINARTPRTFGNIDHRGAIPPAATFFASARSHFSHRAAPPNRDSCLRVTTTKTTITQPQHLPQHAP